MLRRLNSRTGSSLVEVLVTLVIFLTGMAYILRMFPGGFVSLKHDENITLANRLAQSELERIQGRAVNLPAAILPWGWDTDYGVYNVLPLMDPEDLGDQLGAGVYPAVLPYDTPAKAAYYLSDINKFRYIAGEQTRIPAPTGANWSNGCVYVLQFSPILVSEDPYIPIIVYGGAMQRRWLSAGADIASKLTSAGDYAINYETGKLYIKPFNGSDPRDYIISYSYWQGGANMTLYPAVAVPISIPPPSQVDIDRGYIEQDIPSPSGVWVGGLPEFHGIDRASDTLARRFVPVMQWSSDPYEFMLLDARTGAIAFNPTGYGYQEYTARGKKPLTANIDYIVLDWHILREERTIPEEIDNPADLDAKMTLRFIKESFQSPEPDGSTYQGLAPHFGLMSDASANVNCDILAVDVATGYTYTPSSIIPSTGNPVMKVDYKEGIIHFDPVYAEALAAAMGTVAPTPIPPSPLAGKTFRIYYRAEGDWGLQTFKTHELYQRSYSLPLDQRQYYLDNGVLYFQRCSAGGTVAADFAFTVNGGAEMYSSGQMYQVDKSAGAYGYAVNLVGKLRDVYGPAAVVNITKINKVYGVSLGVRAVWRESGRGFSAGQWRKVDLQTYLTRPTDD